MDLVIYNQANEGFSLTNNPYFYLINFEGQTQGESNISSFVVGGIDGDKSNNVQAIPRTITLDLRIKTGVDVEDAKRKILKIIKFKQNMTLFWTQNYKIFEIQGICEKVDMPRYTDTVTMQISFHCEQPFWEDFEEQLLNFNEPIPLHYFTNDHNEQLIFTDDGQPFGEIDLTRTRSFHNNGDTSVGFEVELIALDVVTNPILRHSDGTFFGMGYGTGTYQLILQQDDTIKLSTVKGNKTITLNGTSIMNKIKPQSTWIQIAAGKNVVSVDSEDENKQNMIFNIKYKQRYV